MKNIRIIQKYFPNIDYANIEKLNYLAENYYKWNEHVNLISRKDIDNIFIHHILHSLSIAKVIEFNPKTKILDIGTGGGFPGIPLSIIFPNSKFYLVDSIKKKINIVNKISQELNLQNVTIKCIRAEKIKEKFHFIISRAITRMHPFWKWISNSFEKQNFNSLDNGLLYLKGGDIEEEMMELKRNWTEFEISKYFEEDYFATKKIIYVPK